MIDGNITVNANEYKKLKIGMYANPEDLKGKFFQIFFDGTGKGMSEAKSAKHYYNTSVMKAGELYEFEIDLSKISEWKGMISNFRIDFYNAKVNCAVEYFRFYPEEKELPPIQEDIEMKTVRRIDFSSEADGKLFRAGGAKQSVANSCLNLFDPTTADVVAYFDKPNITANECNVIKVGIKT